MTKIAIESLLRLTPEARQVYRDAFACANSVLVAFGILNNPQRAAHFLAQILHESGGLTYFEESLNYSAPRLMEVWPARFPTKAIAEEYAHKPYALAELVYGGRMGNQHPGDGWTYRGRGLIQLTGRDNYQRIGLAFDAEFLFAPELVVTADYALIVAAEYWRRAGCNRAADSDDLRAVTKAINGGLTGLSDRQQWLARVRSVVVA